MRSTKKSNNRGPHHWWSLTLQTIRSFFRSTNWLWPQWLKNKSCQSTHYFWPGLIVLFQSPSKIESLSMSHETNWKPPWLLRIPSHDHRRVFHTCLNIARHVLHVFLCQDFQTVSDPAWVPRCVLKQALYWVSGGLRSWCCGIPNSQLNGENQHQSTSMNINFQIMVNQC